MAVVDYRWERNYCKNTEGVAWKTTFPQNKKYLEPREHVRCFCFLLITFQLIQLYPSLALKKMVQVFMLLACYKIGAIIHKIWLDLYIIGQFACINEILQKCMLQSVMYRKYLYFLGIFCAQQELWYIRRLIVIVCVVCVWMYSTISLWIDRYDWQSEKFFCMYVVLVYIYIISTPSMWNQDVLWAL